MIEPAILGGELEDAVVGIGHALFVIKLVTNSPDHLLRSAIRQDGHRPPQHDTPIEPLVEEVDASLGVGGKLSDSHRRGVGREVDVLDPHSLPGRQHGLGVGKPSFVNGADYRDIGVVD